MRLIARAIEAMNKLVKELKRFNDHTDAREAREKEKKSGVDPQTLEALDRLKKREVIYFKAPDPWEVRIRKNLNEHSLEGRARRLTWGNKNLKSRDSS